MKFPPPPKPLRGRQTILRGRLGHIKKFRGGGEI